MRSSGAPDQNDRYGEYRAETEAIQLPRALRRAALVLFLINTAFIAVDWLIFPAQFVSFFRVRVAMDLAVLGVWHGTSARYPVLSSYATVACGAWMLLTVIHGTGGASSDYYVGLILLIIGLGVLAPLSAKQGCVM